MSKRAIRIFDEEAAAGSRRWHVVNRGYEETNEILRPTIRAYVNERIVAHINDTFDALKTQADAKVYALDSRTTHNA